MAEHRVPMLSPALHRPPDPEHSPDPRIRAVVGQLRTVEIPGPRPEFRDELRAQLVAITPRIVAEGEAGLEPQREPRRRPSPRPVTVPAAGAPSSDVTHPAVPRSARVRSALSRLGHVHVGRPLAVLASVVTIFALLLGGAVWISKRSLPGDALYGLKRASENLQEAMTSGDSSRAKLLLDFADTRYGEVNDLVPGKAGAPVDGHTASLIAKTLGSADNDLTDAMKTLGAQAIRNASGTGLGFVVPWEATTARHLRATLARIPAGATHDRVASSLALLGRAGTRAAKLHALGHCNCLASARSDELGAIPCPKCATSAPAPPATPAHGTTLPSGRRAGSSAAPSLPAVSAGGSRPGSGGTSSGGSTGTQAPGGSGAPTSGGVPTLPSGPINLPSGTGSCAGLQIGPISLGPCGIGLGG